MKATIYTIIGVCLVLLMGSSSFQRLYEVTIDDSTHAMTTVDYPHHEIHAGSHFFVNVYDADVDTAGPKYIRITTPDTTKWCHLMIGKTSTGAGLWELFENPTLNAAGTGLTEYNSHRASSTAATVTTFEDTTTQAPNNDGTKLWSERTGADGIGGARTTGDSSRDAELVLKQNEDYILKFTPDADNAKMVVDLEWYEHQDRE